MTDHDELRPASFASARVIPPACACHRINKVRVNEQRKWVGGQLALFTEYAVNAEAVAAKLVAAICVQEAEYVATEEWWEDTKRQLDDLITEQLRELRRLRAQASDQ